ncbi:lectin C-type domain protein [Necator americanus]|uniref:Lectin C-type domain protein n=1 Tax=Necator americanus TaxID=51031 RepID=W2T6H1_NECAM|nr:lectin C-type domain protein [Necator americanus]ETN76587.1 lectin C-type domain protein [Necator americanus]
MAVFRCSEKLLGPSDQPSCKCVALQYLKLNPENDSVWIGLKLEGSCDPSSRQEHWLDGSDVDFHNWKEWEPNNLNCIEHSVYMDQTGGWYDFPDNESNPFICETKDIFYCPQHAT